MLDIGRLKVRTCHGWTRRELIKAGALGVTGLSLSHLLRLESQAAMEGAKAKAVILLWLWGGPSHLDTFDLKPNAPAQYRGPYRPTATSVPGIEICELLPRLSRRAHLYTIIRSLNHSSNDHGIAGTISLTGSDAGALSLGGRQLPGRRLPTHGSIVSKALGFHPGLPRFATIGGQLHQGKKRITGEDGGIAGALYDPFRLDYRPSHGVELPQLELIDGVTPSGIEHRGSLRTSLNKIADDLQRDTAPERLDQYYQQALALLSSREAREVFELQYESESLRRNYGLHRFGQCCLLARRLVQAGVRFVQVNWSSHVEPIEDGGDGGWDMHDRYFQQYQDRHAWMIDTALAALLDDLQACGLLNETVVVAVGEFGRTPKINEKAGRDHWNQCYSGLVAGGGLRVGQVIGASDARGEYPVDRPITPSDLFTTVFHQLGIGTPELTSLGLTPLGSVIENLV